MKIECVQKVGDFQIHRLYTFDSENEADVKLVKDMLESAECVDFKEDPMGASTTSTQERREE